MKKILWLSLAGFALAALPTLAAASNEHVMQNEHVVQIEVTRKGFVPAEVKVKAGERVKLVVTRKVEKTCATEIVIKDYGIEKALPLDRPVEVAFTPKKAGKTRYACGMDMIHGVLTVE